MARAEIVWHAQELPTVVALVTSSGEVLREFRHPSQFPVPTMQEIGRSADSPFEELMPKIGFVDDQYEDNVFTVLAYGVTLFLVLAGVALVIWAWSAF